MAKITIQKKSEVNYHSELAALLDYPSFNLSYPVRSIEAWRRFDPSRLLPLMLDAAKNGVTNSNIQILQAPANIELKTAKDWSISDELFYARVHKKIETIANLTENAFFQNLIDQKTADGTNILRIRKGPAAESIPLVTIKPDKADSLNFSRLIIFCEENSEAVINISRSSSLSDFLKVQLITEPGSNIKIRYLSEGFTKSTGVDFILTHQDKNSLSEIGVFSTLAQHTRKTFIENNLQHSSQTRITGLFNGRYSHVDHDFHTIHKESYSKSNLLFKMAIMDETYGIFWGDTRIVPGTAGCEGYQQNKNMILGANGRVDAIPRLEIETENVIASHGSATGEISDEEIFYMMSRGLTREDARKLLLRGFFEDVLRQSFGTDPEAGDEFLALIWTNIQKVMGIEINEI